MKTNTLLTALLLLPILLQAQAAGDVETGTPLPKSTHIGFHLGLSNYLGDLGGSKGLGSGFLGDNSFKKNTFFYGFSISHTRKEAIGLRLSYTAGKLAGSDQDAEFENTADNAYTRYKRNLDFQTKIREGILMAEVYPLKFLSVKKKAYHFALQPYVLAGFGLFKFNPQGSWYDEVADEYSWVDLHPLRTEGQGMSEYPSVKPYKLTQWNLPLGLGVSYGLGEKTSLSFEIVGRKLFTDYLDDVSANYIDPALFSKYLSENQAQVAASVYNKSMVVDPDHPYRAGDRRGDATDKDFYYSVQLRFAVRISKLKKAAALPPKTTYKYDNDEICSYPMFNSDLK